MACLPKILILVNVRITGSSLIGILSRPETDRYQWIVAHVTRNARVKVEMQHTALQNDIELFYISKL